MQPAIHHLLDDSQPDTPRSCSDEDWFAQRECDNFRALDEPEPGGEANEWKLGHGPLAITLDSTVLVRTIQRLPSDIA